jgi:quercetin dioxygenase-like cupin family protein
MKILTNLILGAAFFIAVFVVTPVSAQDAAEVDSKHYKVEFENSAVRVLRVHYGAKEKSAMHSHPDAVAVSLGAMRGRFTFPDGKPQIRTFSTGQVRWTPAETHLPQNLGAKPFDVILVELKGGASGSDASSSKDDPKHHKIEVENDRVRVVRTRLAPGEKTLMHSHPDNVVVYLTSSHFKSTMADGTVKNAQRKAGDVQWRDALRHQTVNTGKTAAETVVIELK